MQALLDSLKNLSQYQHLGFSSKNGITAVLWALEQWLGGLDAAVKHIEESGIKCWALGKLSLTDPTPWDDVKVELLATLSALSWHAFQNWQRPPPAPWRVLLLIGLGADAYNE